MRDNFCLAPWFSLYLGKLYLKPCCLWSKKMNLWESKEDIEKMWSGEEMQAIRKKFLDGIIPEECTNCLRRIVPRNIWLDARIGEYVDTTRLVLNPPLKPLQIDFHLSNKCNLQCRMCASWASRNWSKLDEELNKINPKFQRAPMPSYELDVSKFEDCQEMFSDVIRFDFKGGEPMLHDSMVTMLKHLVEWGNPQNIRVSYVTNGSVINEEAIDLWKNFKEIRLVLSIDGTDEMFSYIRGFDFEKFKETLQLYDKIENVKGLYNVAISIYNILDMGKLNDWMRNTDLTRFPSIKSGSVHLFECNVLNPTYLDVTILPKKYKKLALDKLQGHVHDNIIPFVEWLESIQDIPANEEQLRLFVSFTKEMDRRKGTNFLELEPEFEDLFKEYS